MAKLALINRQLKRQKLVAKYAKKRAELKELPPALLERLTHYFSTYKLVPGSGNKISLAGSYSREHAERVIVASQDDYTEVYGETPPPLRF